MAPQVGDNVYDAIAGAVTLQFCVLSSSMRLRHVPLLFLAAPFYAIVRTFTPASRALFTEGSAGINFVQLLFAAYQAVHTATLLELAARKHVDVTSAAEAEASQLHGMLSLLLPPSIIPRVAGTGEGAGGQKSQTRFSESYGSVSILFLEVQRFDAISRELDPPSLVNLLNAVYSHFDSLVAATPGASKHESVGPVYVVTSGVPEPCPDHAAVLAGLALRCRDAVGLFAASGQPLGLKMGINTGEIIGGVIGKQLPR